MRCGVVAQYVIWDVLGDAGERVKSRRDWSRRGKIRQSSFLHEEVLEAGAVATFAQALLVAEDFSDGRTT